VKERRFQDASPSNDEKKRGVVGVFGVLFFAEVQQRPKKEGVY
jgi:hypothetical protein